MRRVALLAPLLFAAALLTACEVDQPCSGMGAISTRACSPDPIGQSAIEGAVLIEFVPDLPDGLFPGAVGDAPIDVAMLRAWEPDGPAGSAEPRDPKDAIDVADVPGMKYVAIGASTYCRLTDGAELVLQQGTNLTAVFTGGEAGEHQTCARPYIAYAQFAVPAEAIPAEVAVNGQPPVDPNGPAVLEHFLPLGVLDRSANGIAPTRFGWGAAAKMRAALIAAGAQDSEKLREALPDEADEDSTALAFLLEGCAEDGAKLVVTPRVISAELTGGEDTACESAAWFLAVFTLENTYAQWDAELAVHGR